MTCPTCDGERVVMTAPPGAGHSDDLAEYDPCPDCKGIGVAPAAEPSPIPLSDKQLEIIKDWAADDRLWTTPETVEFNLATFGRAIIASQTGQSKVRRGTPAKED